MSFHKKGFKVLCKMKTGKSPGNNGLSVLFHKTFLADCGAYLVNCLCQLSYGRTFKFTKTRGHYIDFKTG